MHETDPLKLASWKSILFCFVSFIDRLPQDVSWAQVCFAAPQVLWIWSGLRHQFHSRCYGKRPQGGSTSCWPSWVNWATRAQAKGPFLGCGLEWNVPGKNSLGLVSGELFLLSLHITGRSQALPRPLCWGCCHRQLGRLPGKGLLVGIPAQRDSDLVMTVQSSSWTQGPRALHDLGLPELKGLPGSGDWGLMVRGPGTPRGGWLPSWHLLPCSLSSMRVQLWDTRLLRLQGCDTRLGFWGLTEIW